MVGLAGQDLAVNLFGLGELAGAVQFERPSLEFVDAGHH
jgi:hypothetical protein